MRVDTLSPGAGSKRPGKRVGRGNGSGHGTYSGRGCKGQKARSGYRIKPGFEGGQLPLVKRLPRLRGFTNIFRVEYAVVSLARLDAAFEPGAEVDPEKLVAAGLVKSARKPVKVLADGDLSHPLRIRAHRFSAAARAKIAAAGGTAEEVVVAAKAD